MSYPTCPIYAIDWIKISSQKVYLDHAFFIPETMTEARIIFYNKNQPLKSRQVLSRFSKMEYPLQEIQYVISTIDKTGMKTILMRHVFKKGTTFLQCCFEAGDFMIIAKNKNLFEEERMDDIFEDISSNRYPIVQFIS